MSAVLKIPALGNYQTAEVPRRIPLDTTDAYATITAAGYLNSIANRQEFLASDVIEAYYGAGLHGSFGLSIDSAGIITMAPISNPGEVTFVGSAVAGNFTLIDNDTGDIEDSGISPSNAAKTKAVMANNTVIANHIACFTDTAGTVDDDAATAINGGNIQAGLSGTAGTLASFPATASRGSLKVVAVANTGNTDTTISNAAMGQASVVSIPDPGAATANFLLDTGAANIIAKQQFVGIQDVLLFGTGTWTTTRIAQGNYVKRHTPGDETSIIGVDITPIIVVAASKGFRLDSFDVIYAIAANALDAHSVTLDRIAYANNVAVSVTSIAITGTLATATQANPYVTNVTVNTPAFDVTADSKYIIEVTVNNAAASEYDYYGLNLRFSQTIG